MDTNRGSLPFHHTLLRSPVKHVSHMYFYHRNIHQYQQHFVMTEPRDDVDGQHGMHMRPLYFFFLESSFTRRDLARPTLLPLAEVKLFL